MPSGSRDLIKRPTAETIKRRGRMTEIAANAQVAVSWPEREFATTNLIHGRDQPHAEGVQSAVVGGQGEPGESECCPEKLAALVEHALLDHLGGLEEDRLRDRQSSALAVLRLIANSNFVGCSTGRSAGFAPLRILST